MVQACDDLNSDSIESVEIYLGAWPTCCSSPLRMLITWVYRFPCTCTVMLFTDNG